MTFSKYVANPSLSHVLDHQSKVTRLPVHWCPSSWHTVVAMYSLIRMVVCLVSSKYSSLKCKEI